MSILLLQLNPVPTEVRGSCTVEAPISSPRLRREERVAEASCSGVSIN